MTQPILTRRGFVTAVAAVPLASAQAAREAPTVVAFDTAGHLDASVDFWRVPSEIWAYRPQDSVARKAVIARLFSAKYGLSVTDENRAVFDRRINLLLADNVGGVRPAVRIGSETPDYPTTSANGHSRRDVDVPIYTAAPATGSRIPLEVDGGASGHVHLVPPDGVSVVSDIDDTVKDSGVLDKRQLWDSTFFKPFKAVPGMADLVRRVSGKSGAVHYVSSTPWHLYAPIREWLSADGFPASSLHLKQIRLKDASLFDLFNGPEVLKPPVIASLLQRWPKRRFILLGDSGEKDPEIYAGIAKRFSGQVTRILIRRAPGDTSSASRFAAVFADIERSKWQVFDAPGEVAV